MENKENKKYFKLGTGLSILFGIIIGAVLFILGEIDDAPGLCLIGIALCAGLMFTGTKNISKFNKDIKPIIVLPLFFGVIGIIPLIRYLIRGIYDEPPGIIVGGLLTCSILIALGIINIIKIKRKKGEESPNA